MQPHQQYNPNFPAHFAQYVRHLHPEERAKLIKENEPTNHNEAILYYALIEAWYYIELYKTKIL